MMQPGSDPLVELTQRPQPKSEREVHTSCDPLGTEQRLHTVLLLLKVFAWCSSQEDDWRATEDSRSSNILQPSLGRFLGGRKLRPRVV